MTKVYKFGAVGQSKTQKHQQQDAYGLAIVRQLTCRMKPIFVLPGFSSLLYVSREHCENILRGGK